jgi:hypothetical protein
MYRNLFQAISSVLNYVARLFSLAPDWLGPIFWKIYYIMKFCTRWCYHELIASSFVLTIGIKSFPDAYKLTPM